MADEKLDRVLSHLDALHSKIDKQDENHKTLAARMDALEQEREKEKADAKTRTDAEEKERKEREEREAADAAKRRADADVDKDREQFAAAQMRADAAYQAWGKQAPHALHGEALRDFRIRLLGPLKSHSKVYRDSALNLIGDDATFSMVEGAIINDAVEASSTTFTMGAPLRKVTSKNEAGHTVTKFVGDPAVTWAPFMGGATKFGRIVRPASH